MRIIFGVFQWTLAIGSVLGTLALFTWLIVMFFKKDRKE
jgi:hypothetical protein